MNPETDGMPNEDQRASPAGTGWRTERGLLLPVALLALAMVTWSAFQTVLLWRERDTLATTRANQERPMENSKKLRDSLDTLAKETLLLANKGNSSARLIVDELRKRGITINPEAPPAAAPDKK